MKPTKDARSTRRVTARRPAAKSSGRRARVLVLVGTRKGAWIYHGDPSRRTWRADGPHLLGNIVHHLVLDPRDGRTILMATRTGHLGPTVFRSQDLGRTWKEATRPPAFPKVPEGQTGRVVDHVFWLTPGHASEPGVWYGGTSPQGLFRSEDEGSTWEPVSGFNDHPRFAGWVGSEQDGTPDGPKLHSVLVDPRDPAHLYVGMSSGGVHESTDGGRTWSPLINGLEVVEGLDASVENFHDPHCIVISPANPDRLYQQNHCGIYRLDRPSKQWLRIGKNMPKSVGDVGFPIVPHPRNADQAWVFPMDGSGVWPRTSPSGKPAAFVTRNGGRTWTRLDTGLPAAQSWLTVKRQAMTADTSDPVGVYFGTTSGELWASRNEGARWGCIARHLPEIYSVEAAVVTA